MAKYTMTLNDYLRQGFSLPSFDSIPGFGDLFLATYCDREIGFETPQLFEIKLKARASLVLPYYQKKIELQGKWQGLLMEPSKTSTFDESVTTNVGQQHNTATELPINTATATPSSLADIGEREDTSHRTGTNKEEGSADVNAITTALNYDVRLILKDLLKEFDDLFMGVY